MVDPVLSAPSTVPSTRTLSTIIVVVSCLSAFGAGWMILSFVLFKPMRTFRHQLILGLAISDFCMAINFLSSSSLNLSGSNIDDDNLESFCNFNGFMVQVFVVQTDYWILIIAMCTYLILANRKKQSAWVQEHKLIVWFVPWSLSSLWAAIGLAAVGYGDIGAWCWFTSDRVRLLVNFIPRWLIIVTIIVLYVKLYFIIHNAHSRFISIDDDTTQQLGQLRASSGSEHPTPSRHSIIMFPSAKVDDCELGARTPSTRARSVNTSPVLKRVSYQMMTYPLLYVLIWILPTVIRVYQATSGDRAPFALGTIDKACIVIQGFANAAVYGYNESTWKLWKGLLSGEKIES